MQFMTWKKLKLEVSEMKTKEERADMMRRRGPAVHPPSAGSTASPQRGPTANAFPPGTLIYKE